MGRKQIYLDHGASTPVHPDVIDAMLPYWTAVYGNPSSSHSFGQSAGEALEEARRTVARLLNAKPKEIVFTGCGSESDNLALRGVMWAARQQNQGNHLVTACLEHEAILDTTHQLVEQFEFEATILPIDEYGQVNPDDVKSAIRPDTALISIMAANNEVGSLQPVQEIGEIAKNHNILFHSDAIQAIANQRWDLENMPIDLLSIAPHKFYGPKGVGLLYVRSGIKLESSLTGGGQEEGRRSGTVNVPFAVGAAKALSLAMEQLEERQSHYITLRDQLIDGVLTAVSDGCVLTGHPTERLPHHASFAFKNINGNDLLMHLDMAGIAGSSGSACKTGDPTPSVILEALGLEAEWTMGGLRLTVGTQTTKDDIEYVIETLPQVIEKLKKLHALLN
ncbi:MAG: cysteine desulfurase family protein [Chloroflexota bacterium]